MPAAIALERIGLAPLELVAKEGLALLNGTQVSTALAIRAWLAWTRIFDAALVAGAMSVDAALGSDVPFDARIHRVRLQPGQAEVAEGLTRLLAGSTIRASHLDCDRVQDPYSLRCQPRSRVRASIWRWMPLPCSNAKPTASPTIRSYSWKERAHRRFSPAAISTPNRSPPRPIAWPSPWRSSGSIAERRIALLMDANLSGLPAFLTPEPGLNCGLMIAQVTAAALQAENKHLATPVSTESLPTSANQEDHVSMAAYAARRLLPMSENLARIVAIELLCAAQGIQLRRPLRSSAPLEAALAQVRKVAAFLKVDRPLGREIEALAAWVLEGAFTSPV